MRAFINSLIAQSVERRTVNPQVPGSSPGRGAKNFKHLAHPSGWAFCFSEFNIQKVRSSALKPLPYKGSRGEKIRWWVPDSPWVGDGGGCGAGEKLETCETEKLNLARLDHSRHITAPAACERQALDGVAAFCVAMKRDGVKRLRQRRETSGLQRASRWRLYAFGALSDTAALADSEPQALGEAFFAKGAVVKWRRQKSGRTWLQSASRGRFLAFCALSDTAALAKARGLRGLLQAP